MQFFYYCLVFLSTVSVAVLFEVKKIYVIERDFKTGLLRARRQNVPVQSHTVARIGGLQDHHHHQQQNNMFAVAVSPPPLQSVPPAGGQQQPADLASTVDLTADSRAPIDYLTPPPNSDFQPLQQSFQPPAAGESITPAPPFAPLTAPSAPVPVHTSPFTPSVGIGGGGGGGGGGGSGGGSGFPSAQAQPPPSFGSLAVQTSSPSNQVHSLTFANPPLEQFTPYAPTLQQANDPAQANHQQQQQQQNGAGGRWELGFDANEILTPPFAGAPEQPPGASAGQTFFQQDFGQEAAGSVRNNKQYPSPAGSLFFGGGGGGGGFDASVAANTKFTPLDAVVRPSPSNKNVYWGTPKTAQQQPLRPPPSFAEPNAFRFNNNHNLHHNNHNLHHHHNQYVDPFQMPFTGQFDGPLSQGTVADHVVHGSFRIKRQVRNAGTPRPAGGSDAVDRSDDDRFGDRKPVYSFVKTDRNGNFKWSVRHGY